MGIWGFGPQATHPPMDGTHGTKGDCFLRLGLFIVMFIFPTEVELGSDKWVTAYIMLILYLPGIGNFGTS